MGVAALLSGDRDEARRNLSESLVYFETGTMLYELLLALLGVAFFLAHGGDELVAARVYLAIRRYPHVADSVFCQQVAGRELEALLARLTPEQLAAVDARPPQPICAPWRRRCAPSWRRWADRLQFAIC